MTLDADDLAAALTAFAIGFAAAVRNPDNESPNAVLAQLTEELASDAHRITAQAAGFAANIARENVYFGVTNIYTTGSAANRIDVGATAA